ncbi:hypothetical protein M9Y10_006726 [Tritrichomonas musculus]|uniref:DH domain-containing protein n=1 Tax=Tritrichomonas musculus TaxID=1915356 RepID=A0ABR2JFW2_9EUKA
MATVSIIGIDGSISKKSPAFIKKKTVLSILESIPYAKNGQYLLGIRTPTYIKILRPNSVPYNSYPDLISNELTDLQSIPYLSLQILNDSEMGNFFLIFKPSCPTNPEIIFPPFIFGFSPANYSNKKLSDFILDMVKTFGLPISNPKIIFKYNELSPNTDFGIFFYGVSNYVKNCLIESNHQKMKSIDFQFEIEPKGLKKIEHRENVLKEILSSEKVYCRTLTIMNDYFSPIFKEQKILNEEDHNLIFGPIPQMIQTSVNLSTEISKRQTYSSCVASVFQDMLFEFKKTSIQYFVNFNRKITDILPKLDANPQVQSICDETPGNPGISFQSIAVQPIHRFPRYPLLLDALIKNTPQSHPDFLPLKQVNERIHLMVREMGDAHLFQETISLSKRLDVSSEKESIFTQERKLVLYFFVLLKERFKVKSNLYLFNDLLLLTVGNEKEIVKLKCYYTDLSFIPNYPDSLSITICLNDDFKIIEFSSVEQVQIFRTRLNNERNKVFNSFSGKIIPAIKAVEYFPHDDQVIQSMIDSSCSKSGNSISIVSKRNHFSFHMSNDPYVFENDEIKGIYNHSKMVVVQGTEFIVGGLRSIGPFRLFDKKFNEIKSNSSKSKKKLELIEKLGAKKVNLTKEGRIYHTCCNYNDEYIVLFGGLNPKNSKNILFDIYLYSIESNEWFVYSAAIKPEPRYKHSAVIYKDKMIIHGGINSINNHLLDDIWIFNFLNGTWNMVDIYDERNVVPRFAHTAVIVNHFMFVIGGSTAKCTFPSLQFKTVKLSDENDKSDDGFIMIVNGDMFDNENKKKCNSNDLGDADVNDYSPDVSESDDSELGPISFISKSCLPAPNCFCLNIENEKIDNVDIIGNFLPGISMSSAVYDEISQKIVIFGGTDPKNKFQKGTPIISILDIPHRYKKKKIQFTEGEVNGQSVSSYKLQHKKSLQLIQTKMINPDEGNELDENSRKTQENARKMKSQTKLSKVIRAPTLKLETRHVVFNDNVENLKTNQNELNDKQTRMNKLVQNDEEEKYIRRTRQTQNDDEEKYIRRTRQAQNDDEEKHIRRTRQAQNDDEEKHIRRTRQAQNDDEEKYIRRNRQAQNDDEEKYIRRNRQAQNDESPIKLHNSSNNVRRSNQRTNDREFIENIKMKETRKSRRFSSQPEIPMNLHGCEEEDEERHNFQYLKKKKLKSSSTYSIVPIIRKNDQQRHRQQRSEKTSTDTEESPKKMPARSRQRERAGSVKSRRNRQARSDDDSPKKDDQNQIKNIINGKRSSSVQRRDESDLVIRRRKNVQHT